MGYCQLHTSYSQNNATGWEDADPTLQNALIPDAQQLLQSAYDLMASLDMYSAAYANIQSAASTLESILSGGGASTADVAAAMAALTQAMAGGY